MVEIMHSSPKSDAILSWGIEVNIVNIVGTTNVKYTELQAEKMCQNILVHIKKLKRK